MPKIDLLPEPLLPSNDPKRDRRRLLATHCACALAGLALGVGLFGMDDLQRARNWLADAADKATSPAGLARYSGKAARSESDEIFVDESGRDFPAAPKGAQAPPRQWTIPFWIDPAGAPESISKERAIAIVREAAAAWAPCGARFSYQGERSKAAYGAYGPDEAPTQWEPIVGWMSLADDQSGVTWVETAPRKDQPSRWTMDLDTDSTATASALVATATHEFGHALGMEHARDKRSIMFGADNPKVIRPNASDIQECRRLLAGWSEEDAAGMATAEPLARQAAR